ANPSSLTGYKADNRKQIDNAAWSTLALQRMCERGESWKCAFWGTRTRNPKAKGRDIALRCPRCALHCVWRCKCHRGFDALPRSFRPLLRGRGHRSAMSLPANGIFGLRAALRLAVQCHEGFDALPHSFRPLLRGRGHRSAMSLPANGIFGLRAALRLAVQCHEGFDALPHSFRPLLRGRGHRSAMSLPANGIFGLRAALRL